MLGFLCRWIAGVRDVEVRRGMSKMCGEIKDLNDNRQTETVCKKHDKRRDKATTRRITVHGSRYIEHI